MIKTNFDESAAQLSSHLGKPWEKIAVQGGDISRWKRKDGRYSLSGLWVLVEDNWKEISAERGAGDHYFLSIRTLATPPLPEPTKMNNPPRMEVAYFPNTCPLYELTNDPPSKILFENASVGDDAIAIMGDITIVSAVGTSFLISASEAIPGDVVLSASH